METNVLRAHVVCLSGSMRFEEQMRLAAVAESLAGRIVLMPHVNTKVPHPMWPDGLVADEVKTGLDALHLRKIDLADEVVVIAPGGYIGESTQAEIAYARATNKHVRFGTDYDGPEVA